MAVVALTSKGRVSQFCKQKSPAENRGAFDLKYRDEDCSVPSLTDLAATYSSKP